MISSTKVHQTTAGCLLLSVILFTFVESAPQSTVEHKEYWCGQKLSEGLKEICMDRGYNAPDPYNDGFPYVADDQTAGNSRTRRHAARGIAEECCRQPCALSTLERYCQPQRSTWSPFQSSASWLNLLKMPYASRNRNNALQSILKGAISHEVTNEQHLSANFRPQNYSDLDSDQGELDEYISRHDPSVTTDPTTFMESHEGSGVTSTTEREATAEEVDNDDSSGLEIGTIPPRTGGIIVISRAQHHQHHNRRYVGSFD